MLSADYKIQCRCGHLQGTLSRAATTTRLSCYCRDCQTFAHALGDPEHTLDPSGGTDVVATLQQHVTFTVGTESLACLSLSPKGLLRWYASCCKTPIANTARDPKLSFTGIFHTCLGEPPAMTAAFGPPRAPINTQHAKSKIANRPLNVLISTVRILGPVLRARLNGTWRRSPFFLSGSVVPEVVPKVLTKEERERAAVAAEVNDF